MAQDNYVAPVGVGQRFCETFENCAGYTARVISIPSEDKLMPVVACKKCGTKNRVEPRQAEGKVARCGKCGELLESPSDPTLDEPLVVMDSTFQLSTMLIFKHGKLIDRLIGAQPKQAIADRLARAA